MRPEHDERSGPVNEMRLQRWLSICEVASRRAAEQLVLEGRVEVNGKVVTQLGTKVDPDRDEVKVDGERVKPAARKFYVALHKPRGVVCTDDDPAGRPRAVDLVAKVPARLYPVGRLDEEGEGLLLLTNDGDFAQRVAHPSFEVPKIYRVVVKGDPDPQAVEKIKQGVHLAEGKTAPARVMVTRRTRQFTSLAITLREGKNREIRRILARVEMPVTQIQRVQIGPVKLGTMKPGEWRMLAPWEIDALAKGGQPHSGRVQPTARPPQHGRLRPKAHPPSLPPSSRP
jgi:23S rRNA pseudouridine2605 synthase